ncbi:MAG: ATP-binding protein [Actinomycetota bacterium]|nr:ATP-binding protein [Actinomycetota bacterium]
MAGEQFFDLNVQKVLDHWTVAHALRELLANALDEHLLGHCGPPQVFRGPEGTWHIRDHGRGLRHEHLAQNESEEKLRSDVVIGRFGVGLKDALAVLDGNGVPVVIHTGSADITTATHPKAGFGDTVTLHAVFGTPSKPGMTGTEVVLTGVDDDVMAEAKGFFLHWSAAEVLARTADGDVLARVEGEPARIYVRGVRVADEDDFLFSYNVRRLNARLAKALNRERANVGRQAYTDRVKSILLASTERAVMSSLADDLSAFEAGTQHTESTWLDIAVHASRVLNATDDVVFVTPAQLSKGGPAFDYARDEGKRLVVVPTKVADKLKGLTDHEGREIRTLEVFRREWSESFTFSWVAPEDLTAPERAVYERLDAVFGLAGVRPHRWPVLVSETMRPGTDGGGCQAVGLWDAAERRIVIRRDQLADLRRFCGTVLHEVAHAVSGTGDASLEFEEALTDVLGRVATAALPGS